MKKSYLLLVGILLMFTFMLSVSAVEPSIKENGFTEGDNVDYLVDTPFDFSRITFDSTVSGKTITGSSSLKKIYSTYERSGTGETMYFTAYCLDGNKEYPEYNKNFLSMSATETGNINLFKTMAIYKVLKTCTANSTCTLFDNIDGFTGYVLSNIDTPDEDTITAYDTGTTEVTAKMTGFTITLKDPEKLYVTITAEQLATALGGEVDGEGKYSVNFTKNEFMINHYVASALPSTYQYNRALWVIEHSYPNLDLSVALANANVNYDALKNNVAGYLGLEVNATNETNIISELKNYVYATTQYAIWKSINEYYEIDVETGLKKYLGNNLSGDAELNKLYQYLIKERSEYENYSSRTFERQLTIVSPESGKELFRTSDDAFVYGPYVIKSKMISAGTISVALTNPITGVSLIDKAGNALTSVSEEGEIYIKVLKTAKVSTIKMTATTSDGYIFNAVENRGRLFKSESVLDQTLAAGSTTQRVSAETQLDILINPKTGVEDVGKIFLVALIAFTLGYIVLRFKQQPVEQLN